MLGFALPQFGENASNNATALARFASTAEQLGAGSLWVGDRLLTAVEPIIGYAGADTVPEEFRASLDPFVALSVAAAVTTSVRLGASVFVAPWYPPVQLARQLTAIDAVSGGRLLPGFGIGWSPEEYQAAGAPMIRRGAQLDEVLDVLDQLWTATPVTHRGARWTVPESWVDLKPVQRPPIYLGAFTTAGLARIGRRGDGWLPAVSVPGGVVPATLRRQRQVIDDAAVAAGRDPGAIATQVRINVAAGSSVEQVADAVGILADNGYPDVFVDLMYVESDVDAQLGWVEQLVAG